MQWLCPGAAEEASECFNDAAAFRVQQQQLSESSSQNLTIGTEFQSLPSSMALGSGDTSPRHSKQLHANNTRETLSHPHGTVMASGHPTISGPSNLSQYYTPPAVMQVNAICLKHRYMNLFSWIGKIILQFMKVKHCIIFFHHFCEIHITYNNWHFFATLPCWNLISSLLILSCFRILDPWTLKSETFATGFITNSDGFHNFTCSTEACLNFEGENLLSFPHSFWIWGNCKHLNLFRCLLLRWKCQYNLFTRWAL